MQKIELQEEFNVPPTTLYNAWLDSRAHSEMTGSEAEVGAEPGAPFSAWDGYISGKNLELEPSVRILQSWRSTDFPAEAPDSLLELVFRATDHGTLLTLTHSNIPEDQPDYAEGWQEFYFEPMQSYFR